MMNSRSNLSIITAFLLWWLKRAHAGITIIKGPSEEAQGITREASVYVYYGPKSFTVSGPAIFLSGLQVCHPTADVSGIIVISSMAEDAECTFGDSYIKLNKAGAKAFVHLVRWNPPGFLSYAKHTTDTNGAMAMVSSSEFAEDEELWRYPYLELSIAAPFNSEFKDYYNSAAWVVVLRVLGPFLCLITAALAFEEALYLHVKGKKVKSWVSFFICVVEAPTMLAISAILALGQFGPNTLPHIYHLFFLDLLSGFSVLTTLLLVVFLSEEKRHFITNLPRRPIWVTYRWTLAAPAALMFTLSASPIILFLQIKHREIIVALIYIIFYFPLQSIVSVYFVYHVSWACIIDRCYCSLIFVF